MFSKLHTYFTNLNVRYKILIGIISTTTLCLFLISTLCYKYFASTYESDIKKNTTHALNIGSLGFNQNFNHILSVTNKFISTPTIRNTIRNTVFGKTSTYLNNYNNFQTPLNLFLQSNNWIDSVILIGKNGEFFSDSNYGWNYDTSDLFGISINNQEGIQLSPVILNPLTHYNTIIPVVIPITTMDSSPLVAGTPYTADSNILIFLKSTLVADYLNQFNLNSSSYIYLCQGDGTPITFPADGEVCQTLNTPLLQNEIAEASLLSGKRLHLLGSSYLISMSEVGTCGLKLVSLTSEKQLLGNLNTIKMFMLVVWSINIVLAIILSFLLSSYITKPLMSLMHSVKHIESGTYDNKFTLHYTDEIGKLSLALNSMYKTIQQQIEIIRQDADEKAQSQIQLLSAQINPHFLYNTLDCIRWEILAGHPDRSSSMIESLANFLRIGLSYGSDIIPIEKELQHVQCYIDIMNKRSKYQINFDTHVDPLLKNQNILKLIIQPLVENSIKHGFDSTDMIFMGINPSIHISFEQQDHFIIIEVTDNGSGIDLDKANAALNNATTPNLRHVGLSNIVKRLTVYYGQTIKIAFYTVPFFKNSIVIKIPSSHPNFINEP